MQEPSIFTKILTGELPGEIIYQDDTSFVILTIDPLSPGHLLVIPKEQVDHIWDLPDELYHHLFAVAKTMAEKIRTAYTYERVATVVEGFGVPHTHIHVFGLNQGIEPTIIQRVEAGHPHASPEELKVQADRLRSV